MKTHRPSFTAKELGVALLVGIAALVALLGCVPGSGRVAKKAKLNKSLQHAKQIALALRTYAGDHGGTYPPGANANEAFRALVPDFDTEKIFYVANSAWHGRGRFLEGPDNLWETTSPAGIALEPGENAYAYNPLANDSSESSVPVVASAFSKRTGTYSKDRRSLGGIWEGKRCVVIYGDGSGETAKLDENLQLVRDGVNVFATSETTEMVNPLPPVD